MTDAGRQVQRRGERVVGPGCLGGRSAGQLGRGATDQCTVAAGCDCGPREDADGEAEALLIVINQAYAVCVSHVRLPCSDGRPDAQRLTLRLSGIKLVRHAHGRARGHMSLRATAYTVRYVHFITTV